MISPKAAPDKLELDKPAKVYRTTRNAGWVFLLGLLVSFLVAYHLHQSNQAWALQRHQKLQSELVFALEEKLTQQAEWVRTSGIHLGSRLALDGPTSRVPFDAFNEFFDQLAPKKHSPALHNLTLIQRVPSSQLPRYHAALIQAHSIPDIKFRHAGPLRSDHAWVIEQVHPLQGNQAALGLEVGSDPARLDTIVRSTRSQTPAMTPPLQIVQDAQRRPGFALYQPVTPSPSLAKQLREAGQDPTQPQQMLASVVIFQELLQSLPEAVLDQLTLELSHNPGTNRVVVHATQPNVPAPTGNAPVWQTLHRPIELAGQPFVLTTHATPQFSRNIDGSSVWLVLVSGLIISSLAAFATRGEFKRREQAELLNETLTNDNELLATVVRHTHNAVIVTDLQGLTVWVNPAFETLTGYSKQEILGKKPGELLQFEKTAPLTVQAIRDCLRENKPFRGLILNRSKHGQEYWLDLEITPYYKSGTQQGFMAIEHDVTAQVRDRQTLEQTVRALQVERDLFSDGPVFTLVWATQPGWPVRYVSNNVKQVLGYEPHAFSDTDFRFTDLIHPDDLQRVLAHVEQRIAQQAQAYQQDYRLRLHDGSYHWFHDASHIEWDAAGQMVARRGYLLDTNALREAQARLEQEQQRLLEILDGTQAGMWEWNVQTGQARFNERWAGILGYSLEELEPLDRKKWEQLVHPDDLVQTQAALAEHFKTDTALFENQVRMRHKNGSWIWLLERGRLQSRSPDGQPLRMAGIHLDISARKQTEVELQQAQTLLEAVGSLARIGFWELDLRQLNITWSAMTRVINEVPEDYEPNMDTAMGLYPPGNNREMIDAAFERALDQHQPWDLELQLRTAKGKDIWVRVIGYPVVEDGVCVKLYGSLQDINDVRVLRDQLSSGNLLLQSLIDNLPIGLVAFNSDQRLMFSNEALITTTGIGYTKLYSQGTTVHGYTRLLGEYMDINPDQVEALAQAAINTGGETDHIVRFERQTRDGRTLAVRRARLPQGGFVATYVDITPLKHAVDQAEAASRSKSQFLANMSHEIRTPMNAILGMLQLLGGTPLNGQQIDYVQKTEGAAKSLLGILNDILDFSKVEAGKMQIAPEPFEVEAFLRDLGTILNGNVGTKKIELLFDIDDQLPAVLIGDALRLKQVLINLAGNAVKFTAEGEVLFKMHIQHEQDDGLLVRFEVRDSGIGISPEQQARIFDGFSQAEANTARRFGGTGLGLAISKHLVDLMGGQLQVRSALGQGSTFFFELPLARSDAAAAHQPLPLAPWPEALANWRVLLIESNPVAQQVFQTMLSQLGWQIDLCTDLQAAHARLEKPGNVPYQAVWLDANTPGVDPIAFGQTLRALPQPAGAPPRLFLLVRPGDEPKLHDRDTTRCVDGWLRKPLTLHGLRGSLINWAQHGHTLPTAGPNADGLRKKPQRKRLAGMRLLLAEDNPINQDVAIQLLQREGAHVVLAENGQQAIDALVAQPQKFDAVLMDMQMPVIDGLLATRHIRENLKITTLPIVAMTANAMASDREACLQAGMNDHIGKPFEMDRLVATLRSNVGWAPLDGSPSAPPPPPLPEGPLDRQAATQRLGGDPLFYNKLLAQFASAAPHQLKQAQEHWESGEMTQAAALLHTVKGSAVTVGANALGKALSQAEASAKAPPTDTAPPDFPAQLHPLLQEVLQAIPASAQPAQTSATGPTATPNTGTIEAAADLKRLAELLQAQDMEVLAFFDDIAAKYPLAQWPQGPQLQQAMDDMDFEAAHTLAVNMIGVGGAA